MLICFVLCHFVHTYGKALDKYRFILIIISAVSREDIKLQPDVREGTLTFHPSTVDKYTDHESKYTLQ